MPYHSRDCSVEQLRSEVAVLVHPLLSTGDKVLACYEVEIRKGILASLASLQVYVITQSRLVTAYWSSDNRYYTNEAKSMRLTDIVSVDEHVGNRGNRRDRDPDVFHSVTAHAHGDQALDSSFRSQEQAQKFSQILRAAVDRAKVTNVRTTPQHSSSAEDRLRRLIQLHKDGLITEVEFQQKRREILGEL